LLEHKRLQNTEIYTHLIDFESEEYNSATAKTIDEARQLIETGFECVFDIDSVKLFRKRKQEVC
jgi:hypothetical protein